jgi:hypothetical protein
MPTIPPNQPTIYQSGGVSLQSMYVGMGQLSPIPLKLDLGESV